MPDVGSNATAGLEFRAYRRGAAGTDDCDQYVIPVRDRIVSFSGRAATFRCVGRAAATQNIFSIYNTHATILVAVTRLTVDTYDTAARIITTHPMLARAVRFTAATTGGTAAVKVAADTALTTDPAVTILGDASADGTNSATALGVTIPAGNFITQEVLGRNVWISGTAPAAGVFTELADRVEFIQSAPDVILRQNQGVAIALTSPAAASNPATASYVATVTWEEYTRP